MIYLKVKTKNYRTLDYKKNIVNKIKNKKAETFAKFLFPNSRNPNIGFRLFLFQISTDST